MSHPATAAATDEATKPRVIWLGPDAHPELQEARRHLARLARVATMPTVDDAEQSARRGPLAAVVVAQTRRGMFRQTDIERIHRAAPLARLLAVHGSWCEGWQRTGRPWKGVVHLYWHQFVCRAAALLAGSDAAARTMTFEQRAEACSRQIYPRREGVVVVSADTATSEALGDAVACLGLTRASPQAQDCVAAIWDGDAGLQRDRRRLQGIRERFPQRPCLAVTLAPRIDDLQRLRQLGAAAVVSKPFLLRDLLVALERLLFSA